MPRKPRGNTPPEEAPRIDDEGLASREQEHARRVEEGQRKAEEEGEEPEVAPVPRMTEEEIEPRRQEHIRRVNEGRR